MPRQRRRGRGLDRAQRAIARYHRDTWLIARIAKFLDCSPQEVHAAHNNVAQDDLSEDGNYLDGQTDDVFIPDLVSQALGQRPGRIGGRGPGSSVQLPIVITDSEDDPMDCEPTRMTTPLVDSAQTESADVSCVASSSGPSRLPNEPRAVEFIGIVPPKSRRRPELTSATSPLPLPRTPLHPLPRIRSSTTTISGPLPLPRRRPLVAQSGPQVNHPTPLLNAASPLSSDAPTQVERMPPASGSTSVNQHRDPVEDRLPPQAPPCTVPQESSEPIRGPPSESLSLSQARLSAIEVAMKEAAESPVLKFLKGLSPPCDKFVQHFYAKGISTLVDLKALAGMNDHRLEAIGREGLRSSDMSLLEWSLIKHGLADLRNIAAITQKDRCA
ncbi:hypothetical protein EIP91_012099 [Steccherinum ochraceum]|uniref:Uncharacterized protein n=1 Tax=Steccherinum ochraceum TaxID=92696 RepID=A0A4R0RQV0_9APHY|nr:hypothetical protein EIP91_012099 [Steccherinum ochraceum]